MGDLIKLFDDETDARVKAAKAWLDLAQLCRSLQLSRAKPGGAPQESE